MSLRKIAIGWFCILGMVVYAAVLPIQSWLSRRDLRNSFFEDVGQRIIRTIAN